MPMLASVRHATLFHQYVIPALLVETKSGDSGCLYLIRLNLHSCIRLGRLLIGKRDHAFQFCEGSDSFEDFFYYAILLHGEKSLTFRRRPDLSLARIHLNSAFDCLRG